MDFRVLGSVEVLSEGEPLRLGGPRQRALLAYLLLNSREAVSSERLLEELWFEPPERGAAAVHTLVSRLRHVLEGRVERAGNGYRLLVEPGELDFDVFRSLLADAGAEADPVERSKLLRRADELWRGSALEGLDVPFAAAEVRALDELRLGAIEDRIEADLEAGRETALLAELTTLVARHPLREHLRFLLILALYRAGRQADALEAYRDARRTLDEELGLEPSARLRELEVAILRQDPSLERAAVAAVPVPVEHPRRRRQNALGIAALLAAAAALAAAGVAIALRATGSAPEKVVVGTPTTIVELRTSAPPPPTSVTRHPVKHLVRHLKHRVKVTPAVPTSRVVTVVDHLTTVASTTTAATKPKPKQKPKSTVKQQTTTTTTTTTTTHPIVAPPKIVAISDAFGGDIIDPTIWQQIETGGDVSLAEQGGQLVVTVGADAVPGGQYDAIDAHVGTRCTFPGDFDARVDYSLLEWPANDNVFAGLDAFYADSAVGRQSSSQWGDEYSSWVIPANGGVPLPETSGSLRIARVNGLETTYFWHEGAWQRLASGHSVGDAVLGLQAMWADPNHDQPAFGGQEVKVAFDNFSVTAKNPVCPGGTS